jgi:hypothetical protein
MPLTIEGAGALSIKPVVADTVATQRAGVVSESFLVGLFVLDIEVAPIDAVMAVDVCGKGNSSYVQFWFLSNLHKEDSWRLHRIGRKANTDGEGDDAGFACLTAPWCPPCPAGNKHDAAISPA